jgi:YebC/PmpR family DNA-binding regulatory protein
MSGHNKWSTIKHKKAKTDAQKGKIFSKISKEIIMATKLGGADAEMNPRLRVALQKAKEANMPNDNIKRALEKGSGSADDSNLEELQFEAYGPAGVAILIDTLTDNRNRTVSNLKAVLNKCGATMAQKGAVGYLFSKKGLILFADYENEDTIIDIAIENGAEDVQVTNEKMIEIITPISELEKLKKLYDEKTLMYETASLTKLPSTFVSLDEAQKESFVKLYEKLEDDDDVQEVYSNANFE